MTPALAGAEGRFVDSQTDRRPPHVVHVVGTAGAGGVQSLVLDFATSAPGRRYRHSLLCLFGADEDFARRFRDAGMAVEECSVPWPDSLSIGSYRASRWLRRRLTFTFPRRLARVLRGLEPDLVHTHIAHRIDLQAEGILRTARLPFVWTIHGQYRPEGRELARWRHAIRLASTGPGAVTAVADELAKDFEMRGLEHPDGVAVTRGGVDLSRFRQRRPADPAWRGKNGIPADALLFGAAGRLVQEKAYEIFIRAARRVPKERGVHFAIAGSGPLKEFLREEVARSGLQDRFHLVGLTEDVPHFLGQLDVFVLSSRFEGFPIALLEALAAGLPAIATSVGGVPEMLGPDGGLIVPRESEDELATALEAMLDPATRRALAARGPVLAERFSIERSAENFTRLYARLLERAEKSKEGRRP